LHGWDADGRWTPTQRGQDGTRIVGFEPEVAAHFEGVAGAHHVEGIGTSFVPPLSMPALSMKARA